VNTSHSAAAVAPNVAMVEHRERQQTDEPYEAGELVERALERTRVGSLGLERLS
jgi:hypothetical protein